MAKFDKDMNKKILIPVDFEEQSITNLNWAKFYSEQINAEIIITHILEENSFLKKLLKEADFEKKIAETAEESLRKLIKDTFGDKDVKYTIEKGKAYEIIEDLAEELEPEMIIIGRNESTSKKAKYLGSNTLHIINETDYPVVSIYGNISPDDAEKLILMPVDINKSVTEQVSTTHKFAKLFNAKVKVLYIDQIDSIAHDANMLVKMNKIKESLQQHGIDVETEIISDDEKTKTVADFVKEQAEKLKPMFVVIMLRDEQKFRLFQIGSIAQQIMSSCPAPILTVKPWDIEHEENPVIKTIVNPFQIF